MTIKQLCKISHKTAVEKGFWGEVGRNCGTNSAIYKNNGLERNNGELIALMHSELSEALEGLRHNDWSNVAEEMADCMIRIGDFCEARGIDLEKAIIDKMKKNKKRPYKHGKSF